MEKFPLEMRPFRLHSMIKEASCLAKCLCVYKGLGFEINVQSSLPDQVIGDERRAFQVILHMVRYLLNVFDGQCIVIFRGFWDIDIEDKDDKMLGMWKPTMPGEHIYIKFEIEINEKGSQLDGSISTFNYAGRRHNSNEVKEGLSFSMCKKLVQVGSLIVKVQLLKGLFNVLVSISCRAWLFLFGSQGIF